MAMFDVEVHVEVVFDISRRRDMLGEGVSLRSVEESRALRQNWMMWPKASCGSAASALRRDARRSVSRGKRNVSELEQ